MAAYRASFRMLRKFLAQRDPHTPPGQLRLDALDPALVLAFLRWLETPRPRGRGVGRATRNNRLAALRSFARFLELHRDPAEAPHWQRLQRVPFKRGPRPSIDHLDVVGTALRRHVHLHALLSDGVFLPDGELHPSQPGRPPDIARPSYAPGPGPLLPGPSWPSPHPPSPAETSSRSPRR